MITLTQAVFDSIQDELDSSIGRRARKKVVLHVDDLLSDPIAGMMFNGVAMAVYEQLQWPR